MDREAAQALVDRGLAVRRRLRALRAMVLVSLGLLLLWRAVRGPADDYSRFDRKRVAVASAIDGESFVIDDRRRTTVALLGVDAPDAPDGHFSRESAEYLAGRLAGRAVVLKLDGTQTRDDAGRLLAYAYVTDTDLLNADVIRDGRGFADRRRQHTSRPQFEQLEAEARKKGRGLWERIDDAAIDDRHRMPAWRREWLRTLKR